MLASRHEYPAATPWGLLRQLVNRNIESVEATKKIGLIIVVLFGGALVFGAEVQPSDAAMLIIAVLAAAYTMLGFVQDGIRVHQLIAMAVVVYALTGDAATVSDTVRLAALSLFVACALVLWPLASRSAGVRKARIQFKPTKGKAYAFDRIAGSSDPMNAFYDALHIGEGLGATVVLETFSDRPPRVVVEYRSTPIPVGVTATKTDDGTSC